MAFTLTQIRDYLRNYDKLNGSSRQQSIYDKAANDSLREMYSIGEPDYAGRVTRVSLAAPYDTGTVSINSSDTAITGSGTTFTSSMVGRYIRFNGEAEQYRITGFTNGTSIACETYLGTSNLSGVSYSITEDRKALPTLCRSIHSVVLTNASGARGQIYYLEPRSFEQMNHMRLNYTTATYPYYYATKWDAPDSGNVPVGYLYLYPNPTINQIVTIYYKVWPVELSSASDQAPIPYEFEGVLREFLIAYLWRENKDPNWMAQLEKARKMMVEALASTRTNTGHLIRQEWCPPEAKFDYKEPVIDPTVLSQIDP